MSGYGQVVATLGSAKQSRRIRKVKTVKLTLKQRFRNWLNRDDDEADVPQLVASEGSNFSSEGMRMQIYKASGGYVVETRQYDNRTDRHNCTMHVITEEQDLGDSLGKIVMMEALKR